MSGRSEIPSSMVGKTIESIVFEEDGFLVFNFLDWSQTFSVEYRCDSECSHINYHFGPFPTPCDCTIVSIMSHDYFSNYLKESTHIESRVVFETNKGNIYFIEFSLGHLARLVPQPTVLKEKNEGVLQNV